MWAASCQFPSVPMYSFEFTGTAPRFRPQTVTIAPLPVPSPNPVFGPELKSVKNNTGESAARQRLYPAKKAMEMNINRQKNIEEVFIIITFPVPSYSTTFNPVGAAGCAVSARDPSTVTGYHWLFICPLLFDRYQ